MLSLAIQDPCYFGQVKPFYCPTFTGIVRNSIKFCGEKRVEAVVQSYMVSKMETIRPKKFSSQAWTIEQIRHVRDKGPRNQVDPFTTRILDSMESIFRLRL